MSTAQGRYERMGCLFQFCTDGVQLSAHSKPRSAASMQPNCPKTSGKRATPSSEARLTRKKVNFDDPTTTSSLSPVASQGQCHATHRPS